MKKWVCSRCLLLGAFCRSGRVNYQAGGQPFALRWWTLPFITDPSE
jgi:hypothetical protein